MCSDANPTEEALQKSQAAFTNTLQGAFSTTFAANQQILGTLSSTLQKAIANPQGYTPAEMAALRTGVTDTVASGAASAQRAAAAYGASHGGADLGSGVQAQIQGGIQNQALQATSQGQNQVTIGNAQQQQQNYWNAINGLTQVGAAYNPTGYASQATGAANSTTAASNAVAAEQQQGWQNAFGVVNGIAGLTMAGADVAGSFGGAGVPSSLQFQNGVPSVGNGPSLNPTNPAPVIPGVNG